jgi:hypothetical protein
LLSEVFLIFEPLAAFTEQISAFAAESNGPGSRYGAPVCRF